jgi:hypothetical protein
MSESLLVRSHVGRDILQSAGVFKNERLAIWEYVSNGLEYVDPGTKPEVRVRIKDQERKILIADNGRGMNWSDLQTFFLMHGENVDRRRGRPGRGFFGTGKSAAFVIADTLRVTTVRNGRRSKVELTRSAIESMGSGEPIPVRAIEKEVNTDQSNATLIEIEGVHLRKIDHSLVVQYIERHISRWPGATVFVNNHQCEYREPPLDREFAFRPETLELRGALGDVELKVKVSKVKLDEDSRGISIFSRGVWHETTLVGAAGRDMSEYIFGELDVPKLADDTSPIPAFDMSRSMQLNRSNELVQSIFAFVGASVERVRRGLVEEERKRRQTQEAKKLKREADEIARIINADFDNVRARIARVRSRKKGARDLLDEITEASNDQAIYVLGGDEPIAEIVEVVGPPKPTTPPGPEPRPRQLFERAEGDSDTFGRRTDETRRQAERTRGGFSVEFRSIGAAELRAKYERDERTIYINLDHPQIKRAIGLGSTESIEFRRLSYEVAFTEYAIALAREMILAGEYYEMEEPMMDLRDTIDRVTRSAAHLYAA